MRSHFSLVLALLVGLAGVAYAKGAEGDTGAATKGAQVAGTKKPAKPPKEQK